MAKYDDEKAKDAGLDIIVEDAKKDPRMKAMSGDDAEEETGEGKDENDSAEGIDDCLNEAFDKRNDRAGFVAAMKKAIGG